jgi:SSS family solute:Na+ symporter
MHWIDVTIMAAYIVGCMSIGMLARGKGDDAEDYFTAGGRLGGWFSTIVVGLSIAGTFFSGISFFAYPSVAYSSGILMPVWGLAVAMPIAFVVLRYWFLPRYLAGGWKFPYDIVEARFGANARTAAASLYIMMRVGWMAMMIYAPTVAIMAMGRLDEKWFWPIVLITGLSNTLYTVVSGIRGVIVTEAVQMLVIMIGVGATIASAWWQLPVPFATAISNLSGAGKLDVFNFSLDPKAGMTVFAVVCGLSISNLTNYIGDQMSLQRYLATGDARAAVRSFGVNVIGVVIVVCLLTAVGLSLFVFYANTADPSLPAKADKIFPHFVATRLPPGIAGLLLAALLAATSIPSGINTLAAVITLDFHSRFAGQLDSAQLAKWGKIYSLVIGLAATLSAGIVSSLGTIFEVSQVILGLFAGPLLSCIVLATAGVRMRSLFMIIAMGCGWAAGFVATYSGLHALWVGPASALTTIIVGWSLSRFRLEPLPPRFEVVTKEPNFIPE